MGKSTAGRFFARFGARIYDADAAVHRLFMPGGAAVEPLSRAFPEAFRNGSVDRGVLGTSVFGNAKKLRLLESIVHPLVRRAQNEFLARARLDRRHLVVLDIPLLFETRGERFCSATVLVTASAMAQRQRVLARPGMTPEKLRAILTRQMPDWIKRRRADFVVHTGMDLGHTFAQVRAVVAALKLAEDTDQPHASGR